MLSRFLPSLVITLVAPLIAHGVQITEIMYDVSGNDAGREWIEIFNDGTEPLDLSKARFVEAGVRHKITSVNVSIPPQGYGVVVADRNKFLIDWPVYSGPLFDSTFSLSNSGEMLSLEIASTSPISVTYSGGDSNGNSLNNVSGNWILREPSPGTEVKSHTRAAAESVPKEGTVRRNVSATGTVRVASDTTSTEIVEPETPRSFMNGIGVWISGLLLIIVLGIYAIFMSGSDGKSGYTIIEDQS